jgi:uncharacterized protein with PIN domain
MVEIITPGKLKGNQTYETKCKYCQCHFRFLRTEARIEHDRDGTALIIRCPTCTSEVWKEMPE